MAMDKLHGLLYWARFDHCMPDQYMQGTKKARAEPRDHTFSLSTFCSPSYLKDLKLDAPMVNIDLSC